MDETGGARACRGGRAPGRGHWRRERPPQAEEGRPASQPVHQATQYLEHDRQQPGRGGCGGRCSLRLAAGRGGAAAAGRGWRVRHRCAAGRLIVCRMVRQHRHTPPFLSSEWVAGLHKLLSTILNSFCSPI
jgi:hypothetical protein